MSYPTFKNLDKSITDVFGDDFDIKHTLKIKSAAPAGVAVTSNTTVDFSGKDLLATKVSAKWAHASGFTLEKLEVDTSGNIVSETSLTGVAPGLKFEFKANNTSKGDLNVTYTHPLLTLTTEVDVLTLSSAAASITTGNGPFSAGVATKLNLKSPALGVFDLAVGYSLPNFKSVLRSNSTLADGSLLLSYLACSNANFAAKAVYAKGTLSGLLAGVYNCNKCAATFKVKVATTGELHASVKKALDKSFTVVGAATVPSTFDGIKFGVNAILG